MQAIIWIFNKKDWSSGKKLWRPDEAIDQVYLDADLENL